MRTRPSGMGAQFTVTRPPGRLYFTALESRLRKTCLSRWRSASTRSQPHVRDGVKTVSISWRAASGRMSSSASWRKRAELDRFRREREPAGLDARDIEHFVDEREQMSSGARDVLDALGLARRRLVELEELGEAEDGVERRAQLVAHAREEFALRAVRRLGLLARQADAGLRALALDRRGQHVGHGLQEIDVVLHELARRDAERHEHTERLTRSPR